LRGFQREKAGILPESCVELDFTVLPAFLQFMERLPSGV